MRKGTSVPFMAAAALLAISIGAVAQTGVKENPSRSQTPPKPAPTVEKPVGVEDIEGDVAEALSIIESHHIDGRSLDYNDLFKTTIDTMLHVLDPHSNYFDAKEYDEFRTEQSSLYFGIGATIGDISDENGTVIATYIKATFLGAPAHRAGLLYGDKILEVNGVSMLGKPSAEVRSMLRGPRGTTARVVVERNSTKQKLTVEIIRDAVPQPSIQEAYMIRPEIGYIAMTGGFNETTFAEFRRAMQSLKGAGMKYLVLDLRNNGGGLVNQAYFVANTFIKRGQTIFTQKGRLEGVADTRRSSNLSPDDTPLVVLVNRNTASASEILAGALQDHDRALIVGESTFGKGLVQGPFPLEYGSVLLLTIAKYETPSGRLIQRDYSDGNLYNYYTKGGTLRDDSTVQPPTGQKATTDSGRPVYGGGGITPDETVKPRVLDDESVKNQVKLVNPVFAFALELVAGRVSGLERYAVKAPIAFDHDITAEDFPITEELIGAFKKFVAERYKLSPSLVDREREFVGRTIRTELVTAAYGSQTSYQVFNEYDNQLLRGIELLPKAKELALSSRKAGDTNDFR